MHGFGLHFLLKTSERANAARLAWSRPLKLEEDLVSKHDPTNISSIRDVWYHIENLENKDMFLIAMFKRYGQIIYDALDKQKMLAKRPKVEYSKSSSLLMLSSKLKRAVTLP